MLDEKKWLEITQGFAKIRQKRGIHDPDSVQPAAASNSSQSESINGIPAEGPNGVHNSYDSSNQDKENKPSSSLNRYRQTRIPKSGRVLAPASGNSSLERQRVQVQSKPEEDDENDESEDNDNEHTKVRLKNLSRRLAKKTRVIEEQEALISSLRRKLAVQGITGPLEGQVDESMFGSMARPESPMDSILGRLSKLEQKMEALVQTLPEKVEADCSRIVLRELKSCGFTGSSSEEGLTMPKWKLEPAIKPKSNLASKYRMNLRGSQAEEAKDQKCGDIEGKITDLEKIVEQLKQFMLAMILKRGNS